MQTPKVDSQIPKIDSQIPKIDSQTPKVDLRIPKVDLRIPEVDLRIPEVVLRIPEVVFYYLVTEVKIYHLLILKAKFTPYLSNYSRYLFNPYNTITIYKKYLMKYH